MLRSTNEKEVDAIATPIAVLAMLSSTMDVPHATCRLIIA